MDATHPTQATKITAGWIRKGEDKAVKRTSSRSRINIVGAIERGHLDNAVIKQYDKTVIKQYDKRVDGEAVVGFLTASVRIIRIMGQ